RPTIRRTRPRRRHGFASSKPPARPRQVRLSFGERPRVHPRESRMPGTVRFHRVLRATPERVYRAFLDPDAMAKWLPPNGFTGKVHHVDARVGGTFRMSFTNFTNGKS